jgi:hypothetical protein
MSGKRNRCPAAAAAPAKTAQKMILFLLNRSPEGCNPAYYGRWILLPCWLGHCQVHQDRPVPENALYQLSAALMRLSEHRFPVKLAEVTRAYFERSAKR